MASRHKTNAGRYSAADYRGIGDRFYVKSNMLVPAYGVTRKFFAALGCSLCAGPDNESGDEARNIVERAASFVSRPRLIGGAGLFWLAFVVSKAVV